MLPLPADDCLAVISAALQCYLPVNIINMEKDSSYPGLPHKASELSAYSSSSVVEIFVLSLKNQQIIQFTPDDPKRFRAWLDANNIRDVNKQELKPAPKAEDRKVMRKKWF